jgi:hypothetical protein
MGVEYKCPLVYCAIGSKNSDQVILNQLKKRKEKHSCPHIIYEVWGSNING